jgi:hypothetical protein
MSTQDFIPLECNLTIDACKRLNPKHSKIIENLININNNNTTLKEENKKLLNKNNTLQNDYKNLTEECLNLKTNNMQLLNENIKVNRKYEILNDNCHTALLQCDYLKRNFDELQLKYENEKKQLPTDIIRKEKIFIDNIEYLKNDNVILNTKCTILINENNVLNDDKKKLEEEILQAQQELKAKKRKREHKTAEEVIKLYNLDENTFYAGIKDGRYKYARCKELYNGIGKCSFIDSKTGKDYCKYAHLLKESHDVYDIIHQ